ncbi:PilN domain-containing protein [Sphaerotilus uruguayifluvii]|uniref:Type IV pilus assembly protein PilN n=1 Tax=Sphaerotilus uruguayifluvii TaxID=2735897 RepID=A0ABX2G3Q8_9BURK|nr:PilN domain-containing protein [Leptothrix sp. C29]NRT56927.1 type IV pilus assembly protein PilN [Leptothrix sp. C29]
MILINLLPHREEKRRRRQQAFYAGIGLAVLAGVLIAAAWSLVLGEVTREQTSRNEFLQSEIGRLEAQIKDIASLKTEIEALKARQKVVEDFQIDRNMPVHLLNELAAQTPEGVYLSRVQQDGQAINITGVAQTNERVSEFLRNTARSSKWLSRPELVEIKAAPVAPNARDPKRLFDFSVKLTLRRPQDLEQADRPAGAASGAAPAASAPAGHG